MSRHVSNQPVGKKKENKIVIHDSRGNGTQIKVGACFVRYLKAFVFIESLPLVKAKRFLSYRLKRAKYCF